MVGYIQCMKLSAVNVFLIRFKVLCRQESACEVFEKVKRL